MNMSCGLLTHALTPAPSWWPSPLPPVSQKTPSILEVTSAGCLCHSTRKSRWHQPPFRITLLGEAQLVGSQRGPTAKLREIIEKRLFWFQNYSQRRSIISFHIAITNASQEELTGRQLLWVYDISPPQWRRHRGSAWFLVIDRGVWQRLCPWWPTESRERKKQEKQRRTYTEDLGSTSPCSESLQRAIPAGHQAFKPELWKHFIVKPLTESKVGT